MIFWLNCKKESEKRENHGLTLMDTDNEKEGHTEVERGNGTADDAMDADKKD